MAKALKSLVVYESPNKFKAFTSMFEGIDVSFCFTQGRIFDLPDNDIGVSKEFEMELVPISNQRLSYLKDKISESTAVLCMTDNDAEGEWIASHIKTISNEAGIEFKRVRVNELTKESLTDALSNATDEMDESLLSLAKSRRLIDRIIGYHDNVDKGIKRGRVLTPVVNSIHRYPLRMTSTLIAHEDGAEIVIEGEGSAISELRSSIIDGKINSLVGKECISVDVDLYNTIDYISDRCMLTEISPNEAFEELQNMYENGSVSYVRTENKKYEVMNGEHKGIHFLGDLDKEESGEVASDGLSLIKLRSLLHMRPDNYQSISIEPSIKLGTFCRERELSIKRITKVDVIKKSRHEMPTNISPIFGKIRKAKGISTHLYKHNMSLVLLHHVRGLGIGTPATYHMHIKKLCKLVNQKGNEIKLNSHGVRIAVQTDTLSNELRNLEVTKTIEDLIHNNTLSIEDRCKKCLNVLRISERSESDFALDK